MKTEIRDKLKIIWRGEAPGHTNIQTRQGPLLSALSGKFHKTRGFNTRFLE